jgi:hypothetical protein
MDMLMIEHKEKEVNLLNQFTLGEFLSPLWIYGRHESKIWE